MSNIPRFIEYAGAFEKAVESDDWSILEPFFSEDAVYEVGLALLGKERCDGRAELLTWFKQILDGFDRRFESRTLRLIEGPRESEDGVVSIRGAAVYTAPGVPEFVLELEERARFDGDRIVHLEDRFSEEMKQESEAFLAEYGEKLGIDLSFDD